MRRALSLLGALSALFCAAHARIIYEDNIYWLRVPNSPTTFDCLINPTSDQLEANKDRLALKVEETVYDAEESLALQVRNGFRGVNGCLYTYTVANLNMTWNGALADVVAFRAEWGVNPLGSSVVRPNNLVWRNDIALPVPAWTAHDTNPPYTVTPGSSVGGLWAVSNLCQDTVIRAYVDIVYLDQNNNRQRVNDLKGWTTGPVPEPSALAGLLVGGMTLLAASKRRRRS